VRELNRNLRAGDKLFIDISKSSKEETLLEHKKLKLHFKSQGPYTVIATYGHSMDVEVDSIPERVSSDRVRPAPNTTTQVDSTVTPAIPETAATPDTQGNPD